VELGEIETDMTHLLAGWIRIRRDKPVVIRDQQIRVIGGRESERNDQLIGGDGVKQRDLEELSIIQPHAKIDVGLARIRQSVSERTRQAAARDRVCQVDPESGPADCRSRPDSRGSCAIRSRLLDGVRTDKERKRNGCRQRPGIDYPTGNFPAGLLQYRSTQARTRLQIIEIRIQERALKIIFV